MLSLIDRIKFGLIQLFFGAFIGCIVASLGFFVSNPLEFNIPVLIFTLLLFFTLGFILKDRASDFFNVCLHALLLIFNSVTENIYYKIEDSAFSPKTCFLLLLGYSVTCFLLLIK